MTSRLEVLPLPGAPEITAGADLAGLVVAAAERAGAALADGDVVCVAQKAVSKAEGASRPVPPSDDPHAARREVARAEAVRVVAETEAALVVETRHGFVCANAGVDGSNVDGGWVTVLPEDPDGSAARLRAGLRERTGAEVGVVVTDTFGRPWRLGQTDVAIGLAGISPLRDERGGHDRGGAELEATLAAVADELAGCADLVRDKGAGVPFVLVRGAAVAGEGSARALLRPADEDLFRFGGPQAALAALTAAAEGGSRQREEDGDAWDPGRAVPDGALAASVSAALAAPPPLVPGVQLRPAPPGTLPPPASAAGVAVAVVACVPDGEKLATALVGVGAAVEALRVALGGHGLATRWVPAELASPKGGAPEGGPVDTAAVARALDLGEELVPVGMVLGGYPAGA